MNKDKHRTICNNIENERKSKENLKKKRMKNGNHINHFD